MIVCLKSREGKEKKGSHIEIVPRMPDFISPFFILHYHQAFLSYDSLFTPAIAICSAMCINDRRPSSSLYLGENRPL